MTTKRNHGRAADKKHLSLVLPVSLYEKIEEIKETEQRNRNNLIVRMLTQEVEKYLKEHQTEQPLRMVAEEPPNYGTNE